MPMRRYQQNHVVDASQLAIDHARGSWDVDGFSQLWFRSVDDVRTAFSPAAEISQRHALDFIGTITTYLVETHVIV